jgi:23S rRNA A2030 N6-methylase RlmJ
LPQCSSRWVIIHFVFSYRHAFHAGNHADVLKHVVLVALLAHFRRKETPFLVVDTHAGAGMYSLDEGWAAQRAEFRDGVARLWGRRDAPDVAPRREALGRFATGCYAIRKPQVQRREATSLVRTLEQWPGLRWLNMTLTVSRPSPGGFGLHGSGVFVVNPPFGLEDSMRASLPYLVDALALDPSARWWLHAHEPKTD